MQIGNVLSQAITYFGNDVRRISHLLKVYGYAKMIGELEHLDERTQETLETAAVLHDIGIKVSEEKYGSSAGVYQEQEGPAVAELLLNELNYEKAMVERVKYLIGHHHTYQNIDGMDYQILVEADFLVNINEDALNQDSIQSIKTKIFKTQAGTRILNSMFLSEEK